VLVGIILGVLAVAVLVNGFVARSSASTACVGCCTSNGPACFGHYADAADDDYSETARVAGRVHAAVVAVVLVVFIVIVVLATNVLVTGASLLPLPVALVVLFYVATAAYVLTTTVVIFVLASERAPRRWVDMVTLVLTLLVVAGAMVAVGIANTLLLTSPYGVLALLYGPLALASVVFCILGGGEAAEAAVEYA
jgi:hypothetical protein